MVWRQYSFWLDTSWPLRAYGGNMKKLELGNKLKETRVAKKLSQEELARLVGTTRQTIISIEKKQFNPTTKLAILLSIALDCKVEDLFYLE